MDFTVALTQETRAAGERRGEKKFLRNEKNPLGLTVFLKKQNSSPSICSPGRGNSFNRGFCFLGGNQQSDELPTLHQNLRVTAEI